MRICATTSQSLKLCQTTRGPLPRVVRGPQFPMSAQLFLGPCPEHQTPCSLCAHLAPCSGSPRHPRVRLRGLNQRLRGGTSPCILQSWTPCFRFSQTLPHSALQPLVLAAAYALRSACAAVPVGALADPASPACALLNPMVYALLGFRLFAGPCYEGSTLRVSSPSFPSAILALAARVSARCRVPVAPRADSRPAVPRPVNASAAQA